MISSNQRKTENEIYRTGILGLILSGKESGSDFGPCRALGCFLGRDGNFTKFHAPAQVGILNLSSQKQSAEIHQAKYQT